MMSCCSAALEILWLNHILEAKQLLSPPCAKKGLEKKMLTAKKQLLKQIVSQICDLINYKIVLFMTAFSALSFDHCLVH